MPYRLVLPRSMATHAPVEEPSTAPDIASSGVQTLLKLAHLRQYALFEKLHAAAYHRVGGKSHCCRRNQNLERALAIAREQQTKSWELRAAMSMVRLWRNQSKREGVGPAATRMVEG